MQSSEADPRAMLASKLHALFAVCGASINREVMKVYGETLVPFVGDELWSMLDMAIAEAGRLPSALDLAQRIVAIRRRKHQQDDTKELFRKIDTAREQAATPEARAAATEFFETIKKMGLR